MKARVFLTGLMMAAALTVLAQKPAWIGNTPREGNTTYRFVQVMSTGATLHDARQAARMQLAQDEQLRQAVTVSMTTGSQARLEQRLDNGQRTTSESEVFTIDMKTEGKPVQLQALPVDEYSETDERGQVRLWSLYQVAVTAEPLFDRATVTTDYGLSPMFMSLLPGAGQWYKGSKAKGAVMLGAAALSVGAAVWCENQRVTQRNRLTEHPEFADTYRSRMDNYQMGRNACIGVAAAVWVWSMVDAATAKGRRYVKVGPPASAGLSLLPYVQPGGSGLSLSYTF